MFSDVLPPEGKTENGIFAFPVRVYYEDTDAGGVVYYANYLKFSERARTEFLRTLSIHQQEDITQNKTAFVVRSCHSEYLSSAFLDDILTVTCKVIEVGAASAVVKQEIYRGDELLNTQEIKVIHMNLETRKPTRIPNYMLEAFKRYMD
jgi:acyl-CoA thioester hydrolase